MLDEELGELEMDDDSDDLTEEEIERLREDLKDENWEVVKPAEIGGAGHLARHDPEKFDEITKDIKDN